MTKPRSSAEPHWHRTARVLFIVAFFLVWFEGVGCFLYFAHLARTGSPIATPELTGRVVSQRQVFHVAASQEHIYHLLLTTMAIGVPSIVVSGLVLQHVLGVKMVWRR